MTGQTTDQTDGGSANDTARATVRDIVRKEWSQFQRTNNEGGRAACQGNWPMFEQMRSSQFLTWPQPLLDSYSHDLDEAERVGRNLITEKYGRMMASTAPTEFHANIEPYIPRLSGERIALQERIIAMQVAWAVDFRERYPKLGRAMRVLRTGEDMATATSFETYLRGELGTYSARTLDLYAGFVDGLAAQGRNLTEETIGNTVRLGGFADLAEAETAQAA
ncbi:hypothetical protein F7D09_0903 [Bifidobacterium leontopitheci]|uniref:DUF4125 domain-containing protein n=2 Tax=Bifidobacterium leontopitheci TaxID=2650774 RepID=A0A6I1GFX2_9BIFI|nr:DUF4125 family protein [Bifidobacterium leontopitheci]KAB7790534.1 hypothetical protein F7D09_0903 [Bifidobacterium leontopitheci]